MGTTGCRRVINLILFNFSHDSVQLILEMLTNSTNLFPATLSSQMEDTLWSSLTDRYANLPMALTAEKLGEMYDITREQCDEFALLSQPRWTNGKAVYQYLMYNMRILVYPLSMGKFRMSNMHYINQRNLSATSHFTKHSKGLCLFYSSKITIPINLQVH